MQKQLLSDGLKAESPVTRTVYNADTVTIPMGAPCCFLIGSSANGASVVAGPQGLAGTYAGIAQQEILPGKVGSIIIEGFFDKIRVPAATTGTVGVTCLLPTIASAGVYSSAAGTPTALTPYIILLKTLATDSAESARAVRVIRRG